MTLHNTSELQFSNLTSYDSQLATSLETFYSKVGDDVNIQVGQFFG